MAREAACCVLVRILLPISLIAATVFRYNGFSLLYGLLFLVLPLLPRPTPVSMAGHTGRYLIATATLSAMLFIAQVCFQGYLLSVANDNQPYGTILGNCTNLEMTLRQVGLQRFDKDVITNVVRVIMPDVVMFVMSLIICIICWKLLPRATDAATVTTKHAVKSTGHVPLSVMVQRLCVVLLLAASGIAHPGILSAVYFVVCLAGATWWACYKSIGRCVALRVILLVYAGSHLVLIYLYQFQWFQQLLDPSGLAARLIGLTALVTMNCDEPWLLDMNPDTTWPMYVSPAIILLLYYVLALDTQSCRQQDPSGRPADSQDSELRARHKRRPSASSERQVLTPDDAEAAEVLVDEPVTGYQSTDPATAADSEEPALERAESHDAEMDEKPRNPIITVVVYIMRQSYIATLISMMVWSITYHSWLTFLFLIVACIIWMIPSRRAVCLCLSPLILLYAIGLLIIQYVYGLQLTGSELPEETASHYPYKEIGLVKEEIACIPLAIQIGFTLFFWVTFRQASRERNVRRQLAQNPGLPLETIHDSIPRGAVQNAKRQSRGVDVIDGYDSDLMKLVGRWVWHILSKYWVFVCAGLFLMMAVQEAVIYRIIYMVFFLYFTLTFQLCYTWWRICGFLFWWIVIIYTMLVLCLIYTFQFQQSPELWHRVTGWSPDVIHDIGLQTYDTAMLFKRLLPPTCFLIACIIQVHYFQTALLKMSRVDFYKNQSITSPLEPPANNDATLEDREADPNAPGVTDTVDSGQGATTPDPDPNAPPQGNADEPNLDMFEIKQSAWWDKLVVLAVSLAHKLRVILDKFTVILWRLLEIHMTKIVMFAIFFCALSEVCALNVMLVLLICVCIPVRKLHAFCSHLCHIWVAIIILAKMVYQLRLIPREEAYTNCTAGENSTLDPPFNSTINSAEYIGLTEASKLGYYLQNYILLIVVLAFEAIVKVHQLQYFGRPDVERPLVGIMFPQTKRSDADKSVLQCAQFFANYTFYKFGLEICFVMSIITMIVRLDAYSVIYGALLGVLLLLNRRQCYFIWPVYVVVLFVLLFMQYLSCLGVPPALCWMYPWDSISALTTNMKIFLFLPSYTHTLDPVKLVADFFQLLFVTLQWYVFWIENSTTQRQLHGGGDNTNIVEEVERNLPNPVEDFLSCKDSYLDYVKSGFFQYMFWVTLIIVFIAGTTRISLFCMGYLIGCFILLWLGQEQILKPLRTLLKLWGILLGYTFFVILSKCFLQVIGCVYVSRLSGKFCWLIQLFSIICLRSGNYKQGADALHSGCYLDEDSAGLVWDATCFVFLLIQIRVYRSHYFRHVVTDLLVQNRLATRGAELINTTLIRSVELTRHHEQEVFASIRRKMERIKLRQARLSQNATQTSDSHFVETTWDVIRSGDYYMFDDDSDDDIESSVDIIDEEQEKEDGEGAGEMGPLQILNLTLTGSTKQALDAADKEHKDQRDGASASVEQPPAIEEVPVTTGEDKGAEKKDPLSKRICNGLKLVWEVIRRFLVYVTQVFNKISAEFRAISRVLEAEKEEEKQRIRTRDTEGGLTMRSEREISLLVEQNRRSTIPDIQEAEKEFRSQMPVPLRLLLSVFDALMSHTQLVCYFAMILNHLINASLLSIVYPFSVFLWAMLSVPRPDKLYWVSVITYTEAVVLVKYLFQFGFIPWNDGTIHAGEPFYPPRIIGIENKSNYAAFDLVLLFCLFIHRSVLKRHGLWKDADDIDKDMAKAEKQIASAVNTPAVSPDQITVAPSALPSNVLSETEPASLQSSVASVFDYEANAESSKKKKSAAKGQGHIEKLTKPMREFYKKMTSDRYNAVTDVYKMMFLCDVICFIIVVFGYSYFGPAQATTGQGVSSVIQDNKVPVPFLVMLLLQFVFMIIDRALFLRKQVLGKFIFQIFLVILVHIWMFFILPAVTKRSFSNNLPAQLWYFSKCVYFALSAYQIRCSYPTRILGNFLTKNYNYPNVILFKVFLAVPFLLELRSLMDWMWTDTTMSIGNWLQVEDIYANIFCLECWRNAEERYPVQSGVKKKAVIKYGVGGLLLFILIFIIWFPLLLFSLANAVYEPNPPIECRLTMQFGRYEPIFRMSTQQRFLAPISSYNYSHLKSQYRLDQNVQGFLFAYTELDIYVADVNGESSSIWSISQPSQRAFRDELLGNNTINVYTSIDITREPKTGMSSNVASDTFVYKIGVDAASRKIRTKLADMLNVRQFTADITNDTVVIPELFPRYLHVPGSGKISAASAFRESMENISMALRHAGSDHWWQLEELIREDPYKRSGDNNPVVLKQSLHLITFNDRIAPDALSFFTNYGIIGLYVSFILVIGSFVRMQTSGLAAGIMFESLPHVKRILKLVSDIYLVREVGDMGLEEELFAKMVFLYRSPETLIKWTRPPKEKDE